MRTEENLRDAVRKFLEDWPCPACFGHELCCSRPRLKQALAEAGNEPEMMQLLKQIEVVREREANGLGQEEEPYLWAIEDVIKMIKEFGYTLEEK